MKTGPLQEPHVSLLSPFEGGTVLMSDWDDCFVGKLNCDQILIIYLSKNVSDLHGISCNAPVQLGAKTDLGHDAVTARLGGRCGRYGNIFMVFLKNISILRYVTVFFSTQEHSYPQYLIRMKNIKMCFK